MKRIIILLALFLGIEAKSQIVGGPITPLSTSTLSNKTLVSPTITGSPNLKGTLTGTGSINITGSATLNNIVIPSQSVATGISIMTDQTGNQYPFIVNGGSLNANAIMSGSANSRYELVNTTTAVRWFLSNNTATTGIGLDGIALGTTSDPNSGFFKMASTGASTLTGGLTTSLITNTGNQTNAGTFSVGSTATVTGAFRAASTMSLGSANLTGGNSGTVAVKDDIPFMLHCMHNSNNPGDASTLYFGVPVIGLPSTTATRYTMVIPNNCTITGYDLVASVVGTAGSAETSTISIRVDNTTDILLSSSITYSAASGYQAFSASNLNTNIDAGSVINIKWETPTWVTNPTSVSNGIVLRFKLR